ncbi:hypothetical protein VNI00_014793 [Paramarasmius palmivorus]|uniref:Uncharacterized protein n=1 Tax=Paramarasmius palmivorus TaxID=297713 RepID=A0AAW0BP70_9AGAR
MSNPKRKWNAVQSADGPARRTRSRTIRQADFVNVANTPSNDDPPATNDAQMDQQSESSSVEQVQAAEGKGKGKEKETSPGMPSPEWVIGIYYLH